MEISSRQKESKYKLYKLHYGNLAAEGIPQLIPMWWASSHLKFSNAYKVPYSRTNYHKYLFFSRSIREWNSLREDIATLPNLDSFSKAVFPWPYPFVCLFFVSRFIYLLLKTPHKNLHFWRRWGFMVEEEEEEGEGWDCHWGLGTGDFPQLPWAWLLATLTGVKREIKPKELSTCSCSTPHLLIITLYIGNLEILLNPLKEQHLCNI